MICLYKLPGLQAVIFWGISHAHFIDYVHLQDSCYIFLTIVSVDESRLYFSFFCLVLFCFVCLFVCSCRFLALLMKTNSLKSDLHLGPCMPPHVFCICVCVCVCGGGIAPRARGTRSQDCHSHTPCLHIERGVGLQ